MAVSPNKVQALREALGRSQDQLAREADITVRVLRDIERGRASPSLEVARRLTAALGAARIELVFPPCPDDVGDPGVAAAGQRGRQPPQLRPRREGCGGG